ncbi:MAG: four helix bundle protein [Saprospiraceae bacterium]|nr:four helix bundle protein [Saprospiraceae bacterium]
MKNQSFEDLVIWKESMNLCVEINKLLENCKNFGFKDQILRSSVSVPSNISEGYERQTNKEFIQFLYIAKGSNGELRTQLYLANAFNLITEEKSKELILKAEKISGMIQGFINARKKM